MAPPCIKSLLARHAELTSASSRLDVEILLCHVLGKERVFLRAWPETQLTVAQVLRFEQLLACRRQGQPVAYLTGRREFWSLSLQVNDDTLIPRPETEALVAEALARCPDTAMRVLDLGTGSGAIALALACERPLWQIDAVDVSPGCIEVACRNAIAHDLQNVQFSVSDWFSRLSDGYPLIVSNPPYIDGDDPHLRQGDVRFEPRRALVAAEHGMAAIRHIVAAAPRRLEAGGYLMIEHGCEQGQACARLFAGAGFVGIACVQDLAGRDRVTLGCKP
jgi:release factor glutamine methyltransferase